MPVFRIGIGRMLHGQLNLIIVEVMREVLFIAKLLWYVGIFDADILFALHFGHLEVEISGIEANTFGP